MSYFDTKKTNEELFLDFFLFLRVTDAAGVSPTSVRVSWRLDDPEDAQVN